LDKNSDGKLSRDELIDGYRTIFGDLAEEEVDKILARVDANGSGEIDYSGKFIKFLTIFLNRVGCGNYK
jgi:calcium-dependent protein kinase